MSSQNTEAMAGEPMPIVQIEPARVIRASNLGEYPGLTGCTLEQSALGGSTLELEFAGGPPSWAQYWQQVTLVGTSGQALFTGQITNISTTNSGGSLYTAISVSDYWYLLERQTSATQISALLAQGSARTFRQSLSKQVESWTSLAGSVRIAAQGWVCSSMGEAYNGSVRLDVTKARYSVTPSVPRERFYSQLEIFSMMSECNPDCLFLSDPTGVISVVSISNCGVLTLRGDRMLEAAEIYPTEASRISGVCVAIIIQTEKKTFVNYDTYPVGASLNDAGVRFFSANLNAENTTVTQKMVEASKNHLLKQAQAWYEATKMLLYMGSVTMPLDEVLAMGESPLGKRINISGGQNEWASMQTPCTGVTWDFAARQVTLTLGKDIEEPMLHELELPELDDGGGGGEMPPSEPGPQEPDSESESESSQSESSESEEEKKCECDANWQLAEDKINEIIDTLNRHSGYLTDTQYPQIEQVSFTDGGSGQGTACIFYVPPSIQ